MSVDVEIDDYSEEAREARARVLDLVAATWGGENMYLAELGRVLEDAFSSERSLHAIASILNAAVQLLRVIVRGIETATEQDDLPLELSALIERQWPTEPTP
jgi:hypothetical protein